MALAEKKKQGRKNLNAMDNDDAPQLLALTWVRVKKRRGEKEKEDLIMCAYYSSLSNSIKMYNLKSMRKYKWKNLQFGAQEAKFPSKRNRQGKYPLFWII